MLSDAGVQDVRECGSDVERDQAGEQNQKRNNRCGMTSSICQRWKASLISARALELGLLPVAVFFTIHGRLT